MILISINEIRTDQTSDCITITAEVMEGVESKNSPSRGALAACHTLRIGSHTCLKFKVHQENSNKSRPEAGYFAKGLKESSKIGANCCTGKLIMWKLPRKRMCSSNQSFISTTGVWHQQIGKPKCRHAACAEQGVVLTHRTTMQQVLEMQKAREAVASLDLACRGKLQKELKTQLWKRNTRLHSAAGSSCLEAELAQP